MKERSRLPCKPVNSDPQAPRGRFFNHCFRVELIQPDLQTGLHSVPKSNPLRKSDSNRIQVTENTASSLIIPYCVCKQQGVHLCISLKMYMPFCVPQIFSSHLEFYGCTMSNIESVHQSAIPFSQKSIKKSPPADQSDTSIPYTIQGYHHSFGFYHLSGAAGSVFYTSRMLGRKELRDDFWCSVQLLQLNCHTFTVLRKEIDRSLWEI